jgi:pimeloyl-ACP methyl ester carboxylesterase
VFAPDLCGYGAVAPWAGNGAFSLAQEAEVVRSILDRVGEPAHLVGHSYGGAVALHVARRHGARLRSLALIEPVAFHLLGERAEVEAVAQGVSRALASGDYVGGFGAFVDYWSGPGSWAAVPEAKRVALAARLPKIALEFHAVFNESLQLHELSRVALPTLLIQGALSPRPARRVCEVLARVLPDARLVTINGAGHMAPLTHAEQVNCLLDIHINSEGGKHETHQHRVVGARSGLREYRAGTG